MKLNRIFLLILLIVAVMIFAACGGNTDSDITSDTITDSDITSDTITDSDITSDTTIDSDITSDTSTDVEQKKLHNHIHS